MTERTPEERERTAYHEAAHCVMSLSLGRAVAVVSIRPTERHLGVVVQRGRAIPSKDQGSIGASIPRLPASVRREIEGRILVSLAGRMGSMLAPSSGYFGVDDEDAVAALDTLHEGVRPSTLTRREQIALLEAEHGPDLAPTDEEQALLMANLLAADDEQARLYLRWLRSVAAGYVFSEPFRREVELLVPELLKHEVISGRRARAIIREAETPRSMGWQAAASHD